MARIEKTLRGIPTIIALAVAVVLVVMWTARANPPASSLPALFALSPAVQDAIDRPSADILIGSIHPAEPVTALSVPSLQIATTAATARPVSQTVRNDPRQLDESRQFALGMIETGNDDRAVGKAGEVSRYQIMPSVWRHYSSSRNFGDSDVSLAVANEHWSALCDYFQKKTGREPKDFDMYVLWNTSYGYYANRQFNTANLPAIIRDRAQRFSNLVEKDLARRSQQTSPGLLSAQVR